ncbi:hypothetical protein MMC08_002682 [Hypocenomyce scalaris]|nr:hypothetical protein [Hypocenomyce scalaris]
MSSQTTNTSDPLYIALSQLLLYTYGNITAHIKASGDGVMNKGGAVWNPGPVDVTGESAQVVFASQNAPSNKITWGVLGAAVGALINYMGTYGYGMVGYLEVYDGKNEVGTGSIFANNIAPT